MAMTKTELEEAIVAYIRSEQEDETYIVTSWCLVTSAMVPEDYGKQSRLDMEVSDNQEFVTTLGLLEWAKGYWNGR